ncbi:MAG TPA: C25 family cysteine peptidase [Symbiobacteriaceae bacterium]|nr:C25 family cysteine peptidase [Symbiobacteriaceae bacterium]
MWKQRRLEPPTPETVRLGFDYAMEQDALVMEDAGGFTRVTLQGGHHATRPGAPQIPYLMLYVAIPQGARVAGISIMDADQQVMEHPVVIMPAQLPRIADLRFKSEELQRRYAELLQNEPMELDEEAPEFAPPDLEYYSLQRLYPFAAAETTSEQAIGPYRILAVRVNPVRYLPAKGAVVLHRRLTVAVDLTRGGRNLKPRYSREQLEFYYELAGRIVVNPDLLPRPEGYRAPGGQAAYLIVTNHEMRPEFDRLAEWKTACGLTARVVTKEDIVAKKFGDFTTGAGGAARDEQEIIRNFLKWAYRAWGVCYVLIGGDTDVIPVREVAALSHYNWFTRQTAATPDENRCVYDAVKKQTNIFMKDAISSTTPLLAITSGVRLPYNPAASTASPGWYFASSISFAVASPVPTKYVVVKGPTATINDAAGFYKITDTFSIPTDLYYASLESSRYNKADKHDWDALNNGLYGYYTETGEPSGIAFTFNVCVGRAPAATPEQAKAFVDKVIRYEKFDGISNIATRRAIFAADYWGGPKVVFGDPAAENRYALADATTCRITLKEVPDANIDLIADDGAGVYREIPYRINASAVNPGWYFAQGPATLAPSGISIFGIDIRFPTKHIVVRGPAGTLSPNAYWVDNAAPDGGLVEKEQARALFRAQAPQVDLHTRLYRDFASTPSPMSGEAVTTGVLDAAALTDRVNEGAMFLSLTGHGWYGGCCTIGGAQADSMVNGMNLPVVVADSCSTGNFQANDAFGEKMVLNPGGGAIAYLGNTRYSWIGMGDDVERLFWDHLFAGAATTSLGTGFGARFCTLYGSSGWPVLWKWIILAQNLIGDPALRPWAGVPIRISMRTPARATPLSTMGVGVTDALGHAVPGARVCAYQAGRLVRSAYTDAAGRAAIPLTGSARGAVTVTVTKGGAVPVQQLVAIV